MTDTPEAVAEKLEAGANDPMWAHHSEFPKATLAEAAALIRRLVKERDEAITDYNTAFDGAREQLDRAEAAEARVKELEGALQETVGVYEAIAEYWNGSRTDGAMFDALETIIDQASNERDRITAALEKNDD